MTARAKDISPRFHKLKHYCIGVLQANSTPDQVPDRFSNTSKPLYISGNELAMRKLRSCGEFLISGNNHFKTGAVVHFYEVEYGDDVPRFTHIYTGTANIFQKQQNLSDSLFGY